MAKVKIKKPNELSIKLSRRMSSFVQNKEEMDRAANVIRVEAIKNIRSGLGVDSSGLPALQRSTINQRGRVAEFNRTHSRFRQFFSNATLTGAFVRSMTVEYKLRYKNTAFFDFFYKGTHAGYKNQDGERSTAVSNSEIFRGLTARGWSLAGVTKNAQERIRKQFIRFLRRK